MQMFFIFFFVSGFCSILYELIWLRLAMAQFGVTSALVSIVLSVFMGGLGLGSWLCGRLIRRFEGRIGLFALRCYGIAELLIGGSALLVPHEFQWGRTLLEQAGNLASWPYYLFCGLWIALTLLPWCACMGATIPLGMLAIRSGFKENSRRSFSLLYLANVFGAIMGAIVPLFLIELHGFRHTLGFGAKLNVALAAAAIILSAPRSSRLGACRTIPRDVLETQVRSRRPLALLFATGLTSMALEVVWIRQFTPYTGTVVYSFAFILALYLSSTCLGSQTYRFWSRHHDDEVGLLWVLLGVFALLPLVTANPRVHLETAGRLLLGIAPFSAILGFITPMLVDRWSTGDPERAGSAYAVNVLGCILGPLLSGFLLLPSMSERWVMTLLSLPWVVIGMAPDRLSFGKRTSAFRGWRRRVAYASACVAVMTIFLGKGFEDELHGQVLRDHSATVVATGEGMDKQLFVNGRAMTVLTPSTKMMAHIPLAFLDHPPQSALVVCFGMGTTYRSLMSWKIQTTAVDLIPSVPRMLWYYHSDGPELLRSPLSRVVVDDGRRYLERTTTQYDIITIDPPPPAGTAGSSLLYSKEFYSLIKRRLRSGGILQQWLPKSDTPTRASVAKALQESFPHVRVFRSLDGPGLHFLASQQGLTVLSPAELVRKMPSSAIHDMMEWGPQASAELQFEAVLANELPLGPMIADPDTPALQDDRPINEYYFFRRWTGETIFADHGR
jgi:spermidine synthase